MDELSNDKDTSLETAARSPARDQATSPLKAAVRRARVEEAEHSDVLAELRGAEIARLEMLRDALGAVLAEVPPDADLFDVGLVPTAHPRLFIDMIGFIEMGRDRRLYRFLQDTKHGRIIIAESEKIDAIVKAVTDYIGHRLVEREKALASDATGRDRASTGTPSAHAAASLPAAADAKKPFQTFNQGLSFAIELLGSMVLFTLVALGCYHVFLLFTAWSAHLSSR